MIIRLILFLFLAEWILISSFRFVLPPTTLRAASNLRARSHLKASTTTSHSPTPSSWRRVGDLQPLPNKSLVQPKRRKMGPSHRQRKSAEDNQAGRVSVFCVGSGINLEELRAHVFRRSFSTNVTELALARKLDNHATNMDDDVLHVTNAPMLFSSYEWNDKHLQDTNNDAIDGENEAVDSARKHFEMLTMATQDIFYFDYGCVVFWGLSAVEEKAALKELEPFIIEPVSAVELENR